MFDDCRGQRIEEPTRGQDGFLNLAFADLPGGIRGEQLQIDRQTSPGMLGQIIDQRFFKIRPVARDRQWQIKCNGLARLRFGDQPVAAIHPVQIDGDFCVPGNHPVVVTRRKGLAELAADGAFDGRGHFDGGGRVGDDVDVPALTTGAIDGQPSGLGDLKGLHRLAGGWQFTDAARDGFAHGQRTNLAVKPEGHFAALWDRKARTIDVVKIEARAARVTRRFDPGFPRGACSERGSTCGDVVDRTHPPDGTKQQGGEERQERHVSQRIGILARQLQVGFDRAGIAGTVRHPGDMCFPDVF